MSIARSHCVRRHLQILHAILKPEPNYIAWSLVTSLLHSGACPLPEVELPGAT